MQGIRNYIVVAIGAAFLLASASLLPHNTGNASTTKSTAPARGYYLTTGGFAGNAALTACTTGYHMASWAEISDLSNLSYNTTLGATTVDSGFGPPSETWGWIRTGFAGFTSQNVAANCSSADGSTAWSTNSDTAYGTQMQIRPDLPSQTGSGFVVQNGQTLQAAVCSFTARGVWCVQD